MGASGRDTALLLLCGIAAGLGLAEGVLRLTVEPFAQKSGWRSELPASENNQLRFRGRTIAYTPEDYVVVLLGDSQVDALALAVRHMPERFLEAHLRRLRPDRNIKVFSIGARGYGTDQELLALRDYLRGQRADLVVVWQTPANDVFNNMFPTHWPWNRTPKPVFWLEDGVLAGPAQLEGRRVPLLHLAALWEQRYPRDRDQEWADAHLGTPYAPLASCDGPVAYDWPTLIKDQPALQGERLDEEKSHFMLALSPRSARSRYGLDLTHALSTAIRDEAESHHARVLFFHQTAGAENGPIPPWHLTDDDVTRDLSGRCFHTSVRQYWENVVYMNRGLPAVHVPVTRPDWAIGPQDYHLNALANDQVMGDLAPHLLTLIDRP